MEFAARYTDGLTADVCDVLCVIDLAADPVALVILDAQSREVIDRWAALDVYLLHSRMAEIRIANRQKSPGARLAVTGIADMRNALAALPTLAQRQRAEGRGQFRILVLATAALASVIVAYLFGIPLLAAWVLMRRRRGQRPLPVAAILTLVAVTIAWTILRNLPGFPLIPTVLSG